MCSAAERVATVCSCSLHHVCYWLPLDLNCGAVEHPRPSLTWLAFSRPSERERESEIMMLISIIFLAAISLSRHLAHFLLPVRSSGRFLHRSSANYVVVKNDTCELCIAPIFNRARWWHLAAYQCAPRLEYKVKKRAQLVACRGRRAVSALA